MPQTARRSHPRQSAARRLLATRTLTTTVTLAADPHGPALADTTLGTLHPTPGPGRVPVHAGLYFQSATDLDTEIRAAARLLDLTDEAATALVFTQAAERGRRRASYGRAWEYQRLTVRVTGPTGQELAIRSHPGVPSDQPGAIHRIQQHLQAEAELDARNWAILGLN